MAINCLRMSEGQWLHHMIQKNRSDIAYTPVTVYMQPQPMPVSSPKAKVEENKKSAQANNWMWFGLAAAALYVIYGRK